MYLIFWSNWPTGRTQQICIEFILLTSLWPCWSPGSCRPCFPGSALFVVVTVFFPPHIPSPLSSSSASQNLIPSSWVQFICNVVKPSLTSPFKSDTPPSSHSLQKHTYLQSHTWHIGTFMLTHTFIYTDTLSLASSKQNSD